MLLPIFVAVLTVFAVTTFTFYMAHEHDSMEGVADGSWIGFLRILILCYPIFVWPVWKIYDEYQVYNSGDFTVSLSFDTALYAISVLVLVVITLGVGIIAYFWNLFNFILPGPMIGWVVYKYMMNPQSNPFHYFLDLNQFATDRIFIHPLPDIIHIPIAFVIGLGFLRHFMIMISNN